MGDTFFPRVDNLNRAHKEVEEHTQAQLAGQCWA